MHKHESFILQCYELAAKATENDNHPFGALLVLDGEVIFTAENTVLTKRDPTAHAETNLVSAACRALGPQIVAQSMLYTSTEPCAMCSGAIGWVGIRHVVYGCGANALYELVGGDVKLRSREVFSGMGFAVLVEGPVLEDIGMEQHRRYWKKS